MESYTCTNIEACVPGTEEKGTESQAAFPIFAIIVINFGIFLTIVLSEKA